MSVAKNPPPRDRAFDAHVSKEVGTEWRQEHVRQVLGVDGGYSLVA